MAFSNTPYHSMNTVPGRMQQHALGTFDNKKIWMVVILLYYHHDHYHRPYSKRPYAGTEVIKEMVEQCPNLEYPSRIHAQKMRTYLATACQVGAWENDVIYSHCVYHISESILSGHTELPSQPNLSHSPALLCLAENKLRSNEMGRICNHLSKESTSLSIRPCYGLLLVNS